MLNPKSHRSAVIATIILLAAGSARSSENDPNQSAITMEFVRIPAGSFYIKPAHQVQFIKPFYMGKYEVTQAQWKTVMGTTVNQQHKKANSFWHLKGVGPNHPIYYVSWEEAAEFCKRLGTNFRLPDESERKYACLAGSKTRLYYGDDPNYSQFDSYAWYYDNSKGSTHPVGQKKPNEWGLYDMYGNVSEWCSDEFVFGSDVVHIRRGSNWFQKSTERSFQLIKFEGGRSDLTGFRVVFTGNLDNGKKVMEIALPKGTADPNFHQESKSKIKHPARMALTGIIRDDAGTPIDGVNIRTIPGWEWFFRKYPEGRFEVLLITKSSKASRTKYHILARHPQRNLVAFMEFNEDVNNLDIRLEQGAILAGKVVDPHDKGIQNAQIHMLLQAFDWSEPLSPVIMEPNMEGKFEIKALPLGHKYSVIARATGYRRKKIRISD
ncbi:MAG: formylglycine-generating enzyme family protein [Planctomycetes bacterium]|nr:formylglycine-generating enzyme family protein [Planctomycetota bacterium]MBL7145134.1 formylglycine-generating enzyme family protein [Phycisphaerae bacterium]